MNKKYSLILSFCGVAFVALAYLPSLTAPFQLDDGLLFEHNIVSRSFAVWDQLWYYDPSRFLTNLTFTANYVFGGGNVFYYHCVNLLVHFGVGWAFYILLKQLQRSLSLHANSSKIIPDWSIYFSVLIFLIHPIQTSAVTYIIQRSTLLASFFYLWALIFYSGYRLDNKKRLYALALGSSLLGVFCKPIIFTLPLILILFEWLVFPKDSEGIKFKALRVLPFVTVVLIVPVLLALWRYKGLSWENLFSMTRETDTLSRSAYLFTQFHVIIVYLRLLLLPIGQNLDYDFPLSQSLFEPATLMSLTVIVLLLWLAVRWSRSHVVLSFAIFWFFLTLSLESSVFPIADVIFEHRLYLPLAGFSLFLPTVMAGIFKNKKVAVCMLSLIVAGYGYLTFQRNLTWRNPEKLLLDTVAKSPGKQRAYHNLAKFYSEQGKYDLALENYKMALTLDMNYVPSINNYANLLVKKGKDKEALKYLNIAIAVSPDYEVAYFTRAMVYVRLNHPELALADYEKVISLNPYFASAYLNRGNILAENKNFQEALKSYQKALKLDPRDGLIYKNRALCYFYLGQYKKSYEDSALAEKFGQPVALELKRMILEKIEP